MTELPFIVFDVNETLLDLESLAPTFERIFGERSALRSWFAQLILYSEALTLAGTYVPFTDIGGAVLKMVATTRGISISAADRAELTEKFASMPPHPEVPDALRKLRYAGFRLFTLTDNTAEISGRQLKRAGLLDVFERRFSVDDEVRRHKPAPEAYATVARAMQTQQRRTSLSWRSCGISCSRTRTPIGPRSSTFSGRSPQPGSSMPRESRRMRWKRCALPPMPKTRPKNPS